MHSKNISCWNIVILELSYKLQYIYSISLFVPELRKKHFPSSKACPVLLEFSAVNSYCNLVKSGPSCSVMAGK